ncbi:MAG: AcrR family transcriptional regulator [Flavobacteriales bacterium]|jgi:AcrR family transcriptional regulator
MNEKELNIIKAASEVFMRLGIKSVNMDDIARSLGISKRTLYQYVKDKNDLVRKCIFGMCEAEDVAVGAICEKGLNAIDELFEISHFITDLLSKMHPSIHFDLEKYHPEILKDMMDNRESAVFTCIHSNLEKGVNEGLYRADLNTVVISKIYMAKMDIVFNAEIFPPNEVSFSDVYLEYLRYHVRGLASEKGIEYLVEKVKGKKN